MRCDYGDGSFESLLALLFDALKYRPTPDMISLRAPDIAQLGMEYRFVPADDQKAQRLCQAVLGHIGERAWEAVRLCYLSELEEVPMLLWRYLAYGFKIGAQAIGALGNQDVMKVEKICRRVSFEAHRFSGYVRFKKLKSDLFYAVIAPDHQILPLIADHFAQRFSDQISMIYDEKRKLCLLMQGGEWAICPREESDLSLCPEDEYATLWRAFFQAIAISQRVNPLLQRQFVPIRYRKNMTEFRCGE